MDAAHLTRGARATKLTDILDKSLRQTLRACSYEKLVSCFPSLAQNDAETLRHAQEQLTEFLTTACHSEFEKILRERSTVERLNELDEMIAEARERKDKGVPMGDSPSDLAPDTVLRAHLLPIKRTALDRLNVDVQTVQRENAVRLSELDEQRRQIDLRTRTLRESLSTLEAVRL